MYCNCSAAEIRLSGEMKRKMIHHHVRPALNKRHHHGGGATATPQSLPPIIADFSDSVIIPLTHQQKAVAHLTVDIAFLYHVAADHDVLLQSLSRTLVDFPVLCGRAIRLQQSDTVELVLCVPKAQNHDIDTETYSPQWAYVPLSFDANRRADTETNGVAPNDWFDMAVNCIPTDVCHVSSLANDESIDASKLGDPMTRIRVSTFGSDYQVIAISINHSLVDAGSISLFMQAWSRQYQLCRKQVNGAEADKHEDTERPNITFYHPIFDIDGKQKDDKIMVPNEWLKLLPNESGGENPFVENKASMTNETKNVSCTVYYRSRDQIEKLKNKSLEEMNRQTQQQVEGQRGSQTPLYVSSNDAMMGEVCEQLEATSVLLCMDWRPVLNRLTFFGYAVLFLYLDLSSANNAPAACRNILGWTDCNGEEGSPSIVRDAKFVMWKMQNETKQGRTDLIWNSWTDFFTLHDKEHNGIRRGENFAEMECCPHDMLMSEEMCRARVDVARRGLPYAIVFPQPNRDVRVYFFGPSEVGLSLQPKSTESKDE